MNAQLLNTSMAAAVEAEVKHLQKPATVPAGRRWPIEAMPASIQQYAEALYVNNGLGYEYTCPPMMFAAATAIGATVKIEGFPGMEEFAALWLVIEAHSGSGKTPGAKKGLAALRKVDGENITHYLAQMVEYRKELRQVQKGEAIEEPVAPKCIQHLVGDITMEALLKVLHNNPRGLGLIRDEISGLIGDFGRYSNGSDEQKYLSIFSNDAIIMNRKTNSEVISVQTPVLSIFGGTQPGISKCLLADGRDKSGTAFRFLYVRPQSHAMPAQPSGRIANAYAEGYERMNRRLLSNPLPNDPSETPVLVFTPEAQEMFRKFHQQIIEEHSRAIQRGEYTKAGYRSKMLVYVLRLALVDAMVKWAEGPESNPLPTHVDVDSLGAAIVLVDYFKGTADDLFGQIYDSNPVDELRGDAKQLFLALGNTFQTAEAIIAGEKIGMSQDQVKRRLNRWKKDHLVNRDGQGKYSKAIEA